MLVDAPFTQIGDDVTVDYDGQVRCHSFEARVCAHIKLPQSHASNEARIRRVA